MTAPTRLSRADHAATVALLVLILLLGWALRLDDVETRSLWADEGWTMVLSAGPGLDDVTQTLAEDQHPPLFFMAFRLWRSVAGETEFATRFFSVLIGWIAVAAIYRLGRAMFSPLVGVLAALLLALADNHIDLSQEVRHYAALATWIVLNAWFYVRWWRRPSLASRAGYVLTAIALLYTHYLGGFLLIAELLHMLLCVRPWRRLADALFLFGSACLGFLPWFFVVLNQNRVRWDNPLYYQNALPNNADTYRAVRAALFGSHYGLLAGLALLGLVYVGVRWQAGRERFRVRLRPLWPVLLLAIWIGFTIGLTVAINASRQFLTVRNFIVVTPAILVLVAHGLANLDRLARGFLVAVIVVVGLTTVDARRQYPDWRTVTRQVTDLHRAGEPVLIDAWVGDFPVRYYIDRQMGPETPRVSLREWRDEYGDFFLPHLAAYLEPVDAFWLIYWGDREIEDYQDLLADRGFVRTASLAVMHQGSAIEIFRYDRVPSQTLARFGDLFVLHQAALPDTAAPGDTIDVALWWTATRPPTLDYSVSVFVRDEAGIPVAQQDSAPLYGASPTTSWPPDALRYDHHRLVLPPDLAPGAYTVGVRVYWYGDPDPLPVTQNGASAGDHLSLGTIAIAP